MNSMYNLDFIKQSAPLKANRYSISTGIYYRHSYFRKDQMWNGNFWVDSVIPADAIKF